MDTYSTVLSMRNKVFKVTGRDIELEAVRLVTCNKEEVADLLQKLNNGLIPEPKTEVRHIVSSLETTELLPMSGNFSRFNKYQVL